MFKKIWRMFVEHQQNIQKIIGENEKKKQHKELSNTVIETATQNYTEYDLVVKSLFEQHLEKYRKEHIDDNVLSLVSKEIILSQLLQSDSFCISDDKIERLRNALIIPNYPNYQEIQAIFLLEDLQWSLFDNVRSLCEKHQLYPYAYQFLKNKPTIPTDFENALLFVRVAQLRDMLKHKLSQKIPTRKEDVYRLFAQHFTLDDMQEIIAERLTEVLEQFERSVQWHKIRIFIHWFNAYSENLYNYYYHRIADEVITQPKLNTSTFTTAYDDMAFIQMLNLDCFDENQNLIAVPPLFAGDYSTIDYLGD